MSAFSGEFPQSGDNHDADRARRLMLDAAQEGMLHILDEDEEEIDDALPYELANNILPETDLPLFEKELAHGNVSEIVASEAQEYLNELDEVAAGIAREAMNYIAVGK